MNARIDQKAAAAAPDAMAPERLVDAYIECWNATDEQQRRKAIARTWTDDACYVDPMTSARGHGELAELMRAVQVQLPGHRFMRRGSVDAHAGGIRFGWQLAHPHAGVYARGTDFAELADDGRLRCVTGFLDGTPGQPANVDEAPSSVDEAPSQSAAPSEGDPARWSVERFARFWAAPDLSRPSKELAPDIEGWWPGMKQPLRGVAEYTRPLRKLLERVPDSRLEVAEHASNGDVIFIRWIAHGTDGGEPLRFTGVDRIVQKNGQVVENRIFCDHPLVRSLVAA